jgi:dTDP-4-amino-4,6-dideoxygalactose transaminase
LKPPKTESITMPETTVKRPMVDHFIPFAPPLIGDEEKREIIDTLESGWITTGPKTEAFEQAIVDYVGGGYAVAVNSCTAALHLSLLAAGIEEGDEVIMSPYTFASTGHVACYLGAKPVFVDIDPATYNIDPAQIEGALSDRTRAILPVHYGGHPCDMEAIRLIAAKRDLIVVEDAAHAIGAEYQGKKVGALGHLTCFSFYATKNMTTGEGGMVVAPDEEMAQRIRVLSMYGISDARRIWKRYAPKGSGVDDISTLGYKCNMMDIQASLGLPQLKKLDGFIERRSQFASIYDEVLAAVPGLQRPSVLGDVKSAWHLYPILVPEGCNRDALIEELKEYNIGTSVLFQPLHLHSYYEELLGEQEGKFPVAESVYRRVVCLPISPKASEEDIRYVADVLRDRLG